MKYESLAMLDDFLAGGEVGAEWLRAGLRAWLRRAADVPLERRLGAW